MDNVLYFGFSPLFQNIGSETAFLLLLRTHEFNSEELRTAFIEGSIHK